MWLPKNWLQSPPERAESETAQKPKVRSAFDPESPLLILGRHDTFRLADAYEGVHIFGGNGSGKTSGPGRALLKAYMASGMGGLYLTAKRDDRELIERYAKETKRDLIFFSPEEKWRFNFLAYEQKRKGAGAGLTENIVSIFTTVQKALDRGDDKGGNEDPFWKKALAELLRASIETATLSGETLSAQTLYDIVTSAPVSPEQVDSEAWQANSLCYRLLERALQNESLTERQKKDLKLTGRYLLTLFPQLPNDTRGSVVSTFTTTADVFLRGMIGELFSTGLNIVPEVTHHGAIIVLDLPPKVYGQVGVAGQVLWKYIWQQSAERRDPEKPIFLWCDESHLFVNEHDVSFQTTARSSRCCTTFLSQTLPNYYWSLGGEQRGKALTESLLGVLQTKFFCANSDPATNQWAADMFAKSYQQKFNSGVNHHQGGQGTNAGSSESLEYNVLPAEFMILRKGGPTNRLLVETICGQGGRVFSNGQSFLKTAFSQV
jgi:hypothetical protein